MEYNKAHGNHFRDNHAPEVTPLSAPQTAIQDSEGLQRVQDHPTYATHAEQSNYYGDKSHHASALGSQEQRRRNKRTLLFSIGAAVIALAVGLGVGIGVGMNVGKGSGNGNAKESSLPGSSEASSGASNAVSSSLSPSPVSPSSAIATGDITGVAAYSCQNGTQISSSSDMRYYQDCEAAYLANGPDMYDSTIMIANLANPPYTRYSLTDCLDVCDEWNSSGLNDEDCRAITYYANLTQAYANGWGGNCFVKNGRPDEITREADDIDMEHTVSAYMSCLWRQVSVKRTSCIWRVAGTRTSKTRSAPRTIFLSSAGDAAARCCCDFHSLSFRSRRTTAQQGYRKDM
ncbi:hypothetical protein LTR37_014558 [Vermiconidia calcicola]|uniref:Uncharacterized protein n=1 Tax=Vermiconidia calcicola TaxID=1690605 RepID=A0ACC3MTB6_9PEZI|nr:hypothetical protein LTR37_014558 [Vermiconidia calcicola]